MKNPFLSLTAKLTYLLLILSLGVRSQSLTRYNIIPYPTALEPAIGSFNITRQTALIIKPGGFVFSNEESFLKRMIRSYLGDKSLVLKKVAEKNAIILKYDPSLAPESYILAINPRYIVISAKSPAGMFYAIETLRQLLPAAIETGKGSVLSVPAVLIQDKPAFEYRGMMLDVSRHFFSIQYLEKYVNMMALYKLNKLHLHLTDDQGWRIEIKKYPRLTDESGWRTFNRNDSACIKLANETGNTDFNIDKKHIINKDGKMLYGGFYTQQEMRSFIVYAAKRHVEIIPEIDMPGHMMAAVKIYPSLTCDSTVGDGQGFSNPICPCNDKVLEFAKDIFSEIADLFPSKYIHIGGDEVDKRHWEKSSVCQQFMRERGFKNFSQLQSYFNDYMMNFFKSKGKTMVGWDEIVEGGIDSSAMVMFWRPWANQSPLKATQNHNKVIMTPDGPLYFDAFPDDRTLQSVYYYNPLDTMYHLNEDEKKRIIGVQGNLWSEMIPSEKRADYMIMPRMTAMAELAWTHRIMFESYLQRLNHQYERLDALNINYRLPDLSNTIDNRVFVGQTNFFQTSPSSYFTLHYTTDGTTPQKSSPIMSRSINIRHTQILKLALFTPTGHKGDVYTYQFNAVNYNDSDTLSVNDGLKGEFFKGQFDLTTHIKENPDSIFSANSIEVPKLIKAPAFGLKFKGYISVPETGIYTFLLSSNDGAVLHIDNKIIIDNDGLHSDKEKGGQVALKQGLHKIAVEFMEGGGGYLLNLKYGIGDGEIMPIPASWFKSAK